MALGISDLLSIFPLGDRPEGAPAPPQGYLPRLWTLGALQVQIAVAFLRAGARSLLAGEDERRAALTEAHLEAATRVVQRMGYLRGPLAKLGQSIGCLTETAPESVLDAFAGLHFEIEPMAPDTARSVIFDELGAEPEDLFAEWEGTAFAAATLGQVHRARLPTGEAVAVKIQYPGIARAVATDLGALSAALVPLAALADVEGLRAGLVEFRKVIEDETDYLLEAENTQRAHSLLAGSGIRVPAVHGRYSTRRVLTTELLEGEHLPGFLAGGPDQAARDRAGAQIYSALSRLLLEGGMLYADPHPGNCLFLPDGTVGLLDFGAVRTVTPEEHREVVLFYDRVLAGGEQHMAAIRQLGSYAPDRPFDPEHLAYLREFARLCWDLLEVDGPVRVTRERIREILELNRSMRARYLLRGTHGSHLFGILVRWGPGVLGLLRRLDSRLHLRRIIQDARDRAAG